VRGPTKIILGAKGSRKNKFVSIHKWSFCQISALREKNNSRNINQMPVVIFFACLDLEQKSLFMDGHKFTFLALRFRLGPESRKLAYLVDFKEQKAL